LDPDAGWYSQFDTLDSDSILAEPDVEWVNGTTRLLKVKRTMKGDGDTSGIDGSVFENEYFHCTAWALGLLVRKIESPVASASFRTNAAFFVRVSGHMTLPGPSPPLNNG
jgi:hypothetical protein